MKETDIFKLPNYRGIAETMSDFFEPTHEKITTHILIREGKLRVGDRVRWAIIAATKMTGSLNLIILTKDDKDEYASALNTYIVNDPEFTKILSRFYLF